VEVATDRRPHRADARRRDDVDKAASAEMTLCRELIAGEADRLDLRLVRQLLPFVVEKAPRAQRAAA